MPKFFVPPLLVLWLALGGLAAIAVTALRPWYLLSLALLGTYLLVIAIRSGNWALAGPVTGVTLLSHLTYGLGFLRGLASREVPTRKTLNPGKGATGVPGAVSGCV